MNFVSIISFIIYLTTFIIGFVLDNKNSSDKAKKWYIVWLYVFLCFGYMTGSDWRGYELNYGSGYYRTMDTEFGFAIVNDFAARIGIDFWLFAGILKCAYLFATIRIIRLLTPYFTSCLAICMVTSLMFLLVNYPMRFTAGCTFLMFAAPYLFQKKILHFVSLSAIGVIFHNTVAIIILFFLLCYFIPDKFLRINKYVLSIIFIAFSILASNVENVAAIQNYVISYFVASGTRDFASYLIEDNNPFFTIGSLINVCLACFVFFIKDYFLNEDSKYKLILKFSIVSSFLFRILLIVPTGFRLTLPLSIFSAIIFVSYFYKYNQNIIKYGIIALYLVTFGKDLYTSYVYIPYSNSIPYIVTQKHLPYSERSKYNYVEYEKRMGHQYYR